MPSNHGSKSRDSTLEFFNQQEQPKISNFADETSFEFPVIPEYDGIQVNLKKSNFMKSKNPNESTISHTSINLETLN